MSTTTSALLGPHHTTRSPARSPNAARPAATWSTFASSAAHVITAPSSMTAVASGTGIGTNCNFVAMVRFAGRGDVYLRRLDGRRKKVKQLLWGDFLNVVETDDEWCKVKWGPDHYWIRQQDTEEERPLEVVFVDVGQGDGCLLVSPETGAGEKVVLIDAGERRNMYNFVKWRF